MNVILKLIFMSACFLFLLTGAVEATVYKYKDDSGTLCYTDDLSTVPDKYQSRVVIVPDKKEKHEKVQKKPSLKTGADSSGVKEKKETAAPNKMGFRYNWLFLIVLFISGFLVANHLKRSRRMEFAFRVRVATLFLVLLLAAALNQDITKDYYGLISDKYLKIRSELKAHEERDKKPLKSLSEKVDEMMQGSNK